MLAFYFHYCLRDIIMNHIESLIERKSYIPFLRYVLISSIIAGAVFFS